MSKGELKLERWAVDQIKPYEKNAKIHSTEQIKSLAEVIKSQGWDVPIVVDRDGVIIKGHGRRLAALHLGLKEVPVIVRRDLTPAQVKAARLSDNRVALGDYDTELLKIELGELSDSGYEMGTLGFDEKELSMMLEDLGAMSDGAFEDGDVHVPAGSGPAPSSPKTDQQSPKAGASIQIHEALGFKHLPLEFQRVVAKFVAFAEAETGETGAVAFARMCQSVVTDREVRA